MYLAQRPLEVDFTSEVSWDSWSETFVPSFESRQTRLERLFMLLACSMISGVNARHRHPPASGVRMYIHAPHPPLIRDCYMKPPTLLLNYRHLPMTNVYDDRVKRNDVGVSSNECSTSSLLRIAKGGSCRSIVILERALSLPSKLCNSIRSKDEAISVGYIKERSNDKL